MRIPIMLTLLAATATPASAHATRPLPLWMLIDQADVIVVAEVESISKRHARVRVTETLKGVAPTELRLAHAGTMPARISSGTQVVVFLGRTDVPPDGLVVIGGVAGT